MWHNGCMFVEFKKIHKKAILPVYQTKHSAGMDVHAALDTPIIIAPLERALVPCGFAMAIPEGHEVQVRARSGLALKHGIGLVNGVGTIDADYRGELGVLLINLSKEPFTINSGDRIAQIIVAKYERIEWQSVAELGETDRGSDGFGSTGSGA